MRTEQGCLASGTTADPAVVQFPFGSELSADGQSVEVPDFGTLRLGDTFQGGGGMGDLAYITGVPVECQTGTSFISWQS